ncbi:MBL fold metallo-hydrolase [Pseudomonadales bacterium]|nr:MBL fold metallo-hydrolase [Pseudomonadales bacterium]MDA9256417.1 MBL fold metallo-hydrolase [Pseudomonadales bacterium]MDB2645520.1 MBL fold metallo-hydrolase [Pseudomonadales bacterium]MDC1322506.1 MBL fold metallo-hydrolase [Pseudomonadales bacterium]
MHISIKTLLILMGTTILSISNLWAADRFAGVEIKAQLVSGSVHMLTGSGGNIGVSIGTDGTLIIDDQFAPLAEKIQNALTKLGGDRPRLILNTHFHGDHTGSNPSFGNSGAIIAHDNVRVRLANQDGFAPSGLPVVTFAQQLTVHFNGDELALIHLPNGHTDGDSVVWFKQANVIHMGDHFFNGAFPYIDIGSGGSVSGVIRNLEQVIQMVPADIKIIPGHGPMANIADLSKSLATIKATQKIIQQGVDAGLSDSKIEAKLSDYASWGKGFINTSRWISIIKSDLENN